MHGNTAATRDQSGTMPKYRIFPLLNEKTQLKQMRKRHVGTIYWVTCFGGVPVPQKLVRTILSKANRRQSLKIFEKWEGRGIKYDKVIKSLRAHF